MPHAHAAVRRGAITALDGRLELYKVSLKYDNPEARLSHDFPLDMQQKEVREMVSSGNTGDPFPKLNSQ